MKYLKYFGFLTVLIPIAVFAFVKPVKIVLPQLAGIKCSKQWICVDNQERFQEAENLYNDSLYKIEKKLTKFEYKPKVVFCSSNECFSKFGFSKASGQSIGSFGVVIGPRGWKSHYVKHELIHQWQSSNFGAISVWLASNWVIEGMAYSLSDDPRKKLSEPFQTYRSQYNRVFGQLSGFKLKLALKKEI